MGLFATDSDAADKERWAKLRELVAAGLRNFQVLGPSLKEIRDRQLYRFRYTTFEDCCTGEWKITARHAGRLILAYETSLQIGPEGLDDVSERQLRPLTTLPPEERLAAFNEAADEGHTTAAIERAVAKRKRRPAQKTTVKRHRIRVPGGSIVIEPNRRATSVADMLQAALQIVSAKNAA